MELAVTLRDHQSVLLPLGRTSQISIISGRCFSNRPFKRSSCTSRWPIFTCCCSSHNGVFPKPRFWLKLHSFSSVFVVDMEDRSSFSSKVLPSTAPWTRCISDEVNCRGSRDRGWWAWPPSPLEGERWSILTRDMNQPVDGFIFLCTLWSLQTRCLGQSPNYQRQISSSSAAVKGLEFF